MKSRNAVNRGPRLIIDGKLLPLGTRAAVRAPSDGARSLAWASASCHSLFASRAATRHASSSCNWSLCLEAEVTGGVAGAGMVVAASRPGVLTAVVGGHLAGLSVRAGWKLGKAAAASLRAGFCQKGLSKHKLTIQLREDIRRHMRAMEG